MKRTIGTGLAGATLVAVCGLAATRILTLPAKAAPAQAAAPPAAADPSAANANGAASNVATARAKVAELLDGKVYPLTLKSDQIDSRFHLMKVIDTQGHYGMYASTGDTIVFGNQTFLVIYDVPLTSSLAHPPQPKPASTGKLMLLNMNEVEAITDIASITDDNGPEPAPAPEKLNK